MSSAVSLPRMDPATAGLPSGVPPQAWRSLSRHQLDAAYNNSAAVSDSAAWLETWSARSARLRASQPELLNLRYGPAERNCLDIFRSGAPDAPLFVFIHGGYWQRNSKDIFSCMAEGLLAHGVDVALPGYTLAPEASLTRIVGETRSAVRWLRTNASVRGISCSRLMISGWSAGGHLAASCMDMSEIDAGLAISGVFDLEPIAHCYLNDALRLTPDEIFSLSPLRHPPAASCKFGVAWGLDELPELQRQSIGLASEWSAAGRACATSPMAGANHFSILNELERPDGALTRLALARLR